MVLGSRRRLTRVDGTTDTSSDSRESETDGDEDEGSQYEMEPWIDFLKRATYLAEEQAQAAGLQEWLSSWRSKQWRWARKVVTDGRKKWSNTALQWNPQLHASRYSARAQARPKKKWTDDVQGYLSNLGITQPWEDLAKIGEIWEDLEAGFLTWGLTATRHTASF